MKYINPTEINKPGIKTKISLCLEYRTKSPLSLFFLSKLNRITKTLTE
jgi:hypothetical protein